MKKLILYYIIFLFILMPYKNVFAFTGSTLGALSSGNNSSSGNSSGEVKWTNEKELSSSGDVSYKCQYNKGISTSSTISINAYDLYGNNLIPESLEFSNSLIAGTALRMNIFESRAVSYNVSLNVTKTYTEKIPNQTKSYSCMGNAYCRNINAKSQQYIRDNCEASEENDCYLNVTTKTTYTSRVKTENVPSDDAYYTECRNLAIKDAVSSINDYLNGESYEISATDSNYVNNFMYGYFATDIKVSNNCNTSMSSCSASSKIRFFIKNVCMNMTNGEVSYNNNNEGCSANEVKVEDYVSGSDKYFHYFIPMGATSISANKENYSFVINLTKKTQYSPEDCIYTIEQNNDGSYKDFLVAVDGTNFTGNRNNDILLVGNKGCKGNVLVKVPVIQKFYLESSDNSHVPSITNFGFYFRKIDINNPFKKELKENSLWLDYADTSFNNSFKEITYVADNKNLSKVRSINEESKYFEWTNMNSNGTSNLIGNSGDNVIAKRVNSGKYYPLGYGPKLLPNKDNTGVINIDNIKK